MVFIMSLADKIKEARKITVNIGNKVFTGYRSTTEQLGMYLANDLHQAEVARRHISGWSGVTEKDLYEDGGNSNVPFDKELFDLIIGDKPEWYSKIFQEVTLKAIEIINGKAENEKK